MCGGGGRAGGGWIRHTGGFSLLPGMEMTFPVMWLMFTGWTQHEDVMLRQNESLIDLQFSLTKTHFAL